MSDNKNSDFLAEIYRGAKMGSESIDTVLEKVKDGKLKAELLREQEDFSQFEQKARREITERGETPAPLKKSQVMGAYMGIQMNTALDSTASRIADLMIQGNNMGIIGITKTMNNHKSSDKSIMRLGEELIELQQNNIEQLRPFLS